MSRPNARAVLTRAVSTVWAADRRGTVTAGVLQVVGALSGLGVVVASKLALDAILGNSTRLSGRLLLALVLVALTTALSTSLAAFQQLQQRVLAERVDQVVWTRMMAATSRVDLETWQSTEFMDRLDRVRTNALQRPTQVVSALFALAGASFGAIGLVIALLAIQPVLIPVLLAAGLPAVVFSRMSSRREFAFVRRVNSVNRRRWYLRRLLTDRPFAAEVRAFDAAPHLMERHHEENAEVLGELRRHIRARQLLALASTGSSALVLAVALALIVLLVHDGHLSLAEAGAAAIAARLLGGQLSTMFSSLGTLIESGPFLADLEGFVGSRPAAVPQPGHPRPLHDALRAEGVSFRYAGRDRPAVDHVSLTIPRGQVVALVGENGSGKTTLAKLVAGLFEPESGSVTWDGDADLPRADLRAGVSVLFQDFVRYQMTGRENIAIAQPGRAADLDEVRAAAARAGIDDALTALPDGYDTPLGLELAEGSDLSGGQWQRLALARAFFRDTPVVVLDEPTAALDPRSEHELFRDVRAVLGGRAALLISHRFSSVRLADHIYVLDDGRVVEHGSHEELMSLPSGRYAELYTLQAAAYLR